MVIPRLSSTLHKGSLGRIAIIGGSRDYAGAPFFAASAAMRMGADLIHIFTSDVNTATAIRSYGPDLIVSFPYTRCLGPPPRGVGKNSPTTLASWLSKFHCVVIGPGLGRENPRRKVALITRIVRECVSRSIPLVIDADGLHFLPEYYQALEGYERVVLTPNVAEVRSLFHGLLGPCTSEDMSPLMMAEQVARAVSGPAVFLKGKNDALVTPDSSLEFDEQKIRCVDIPGALDAAYDFPGTVNFVQSALYTLYGSDLHFSSLHSVPTERTCLRRIAGQGDMLCGVMSAFLAWFLIFRGEFAGESTIIDRFPENIQNRLRLVFAGSNISTRDRMLVYVACASNIMRHAAWTAFAEHGRAISAAHILQKISAVSAQL